MEEFLARKQRHPQWAQPFEQELKRVDAHPSRRYFIYKSIIVSNLYGVDIMEEAVEICKLRLFLKLVAQVEDVAQIEPLPDIDFNIRAGNTLVGYASLEEIEQAKTGKFDFGGIVDRVKAVDRSIATFRRLQTESGISAQHFREAKENLQRDLRALEAELNADLAFEYGVTKEKDLPKFVASHKPFHWYIEFYDIMAHGGFDVIIGNPPYVEYRTVRNEYAVIGYETEDCANLYCYVMERSLWLMRWGGRFGMIVPVASVGLDKTDTLRELVEKTMSDLWVSSYAIRPSKLFEGVDQRLCIQLGRSSEAEQCRIRSTQYMRWNAEAREGLFDTLAYADVTGLSVLGRTAKLSDPLATEVVRKMLAHAPSCGEQMADDSGTLLHYHRSPSYWIRAMDFEPYFRSATRSRSVYHFRDIYFVDADTSRFVGALLNSSTYFLWFICFGNARNIATSDIESVPIGTPSEAVLRETRRLLSKLMDDYQRHSRRTVREDCEYQEFDAAQSKPIIDEIDRVLAEHFGFTDEELDFIINYDIKYRLGADEGNGDVWRIPQEGNNPHPAPFPVELAARCIKATNAQIVLDPFMGSGSTAIAAESLGREWVGIDVSADYCKLAKERLLATKGLLRE